jgi:thiol:disulfide interchange protein DsbD
MLNLQRLARCGACVFVLLLAVGSLPAQALESAPVTTSHATATLVSDTDAVAAGQAFHVGLRLRLAPGWHTYGQDPGDAGIPPELDLVLPKGASSGPIAWPPAQRMTEGPLVTYGYTGEVVLPVQVTPAGPTQLTATARYLVCETICVPEEARLVLNLPLGSPAPSAQAGLFVLGSGTPAMPDWPRVMLLAFAGGAILNLMPCVFPVLAMKALALVRLSGAARRERRTHALSFTAGILVAFVGLACVLLVLRAAGSAAGWGFQFQSPVFVAAMVWLLFAIGLNLSGVYQVGGAMVGAGQGLAGRAGHIGSFFTGLLAALVATPCTAPFMGVAIAAALSAPAVLTVAVFVAMGFGLAAPYLLMAALPGIAHVLPRPGRWMEIVRQGLAFPMYAAAAWLLWVVDQEAGSGGVLGTAAGLVLLGFAAWALGVSQTASGQGRRVGQAACLAAGLAALTVLPGITAASTPADEAAEVFSPARLAALQAEGRPVFVNLTAAWCVTCLVNERVALAPAAVRAAFAAHHVAYLKGDWTRQDPQITAFLHQAGREGVPLYLIYAPGNPVPTVLPQILTESTVLSEVDRTGG